MAIGPTRTVSPSRTVVTFWTGAIGGATPNCGSLRGATPDVSTDALHGVAATVAPDRR